jgi:hypothetical protein
MDSTPIFQPCADESYLPVVQALVHLHEDKQAAPVLLGLQAGTASNADENLRTVFAER